MPDRASRKTRARRDLTLHPETAAELDAAAAITADSLLQAKAEYARVAPAAFRALLDAPEITDNA